MEEIYLQLNKFAGRWNTQGKIYATESFAEIKIIGIDTYEWILNNSFLLHKADVWIGKENSQTYEIIGFESKSKQLGMQYYNNNGEQGLMHAKIAGSIWTFTGEKLRFSGSFSENDTVFSGIWEQLMNDKDWVNFMEIKLTKALLLP